MDRMDELVVLRAIAEAGSLARAARKLGRSPPALTRALAALESRAGVRLVERTTRRLAFTDAGRRLVDRARALIADYEAAVHGEAAAPVRGLLRVTAPLQFGRRHMAAIVASFLDRYPEAQIELILNDRNLDLIDERARCGCLSASIEGSRSSTTSFTEHSAERSEAGSAVASQLPAVRVGSEPLQIALWWECRVWAETAGWPNGSRRADRRRSHATPKARTPPKD